MRLRAPARCAVLLLALLPMLSVTLAALQQHKDSMLPCLEVDSAMGMAVAKWRSCNSNASIALDDTGLKC